MSRIPPEVFSVVANNLRRFCLEKGMLEAWPQSQLDILTACEDPSNIGSFYTNDCNGKNTKWPLRQTGQMVLEHELLKLGKEKGPEHPGFFCFTTSYRNEKNPVPGRHYNVFPMFEFEKPGNMEDLRVFETELLDALGFDNLPYHKADYMDVLGILNRYETLKQEFNNSNNFKEITHREEDLISEFFGWKILFLENFPNYTSPFWNMKKMGNYANKIDVIINGHETIGSAERSCNVDEMRNEFKTISDGLYANTLYNEFTKERVDEELEEFLQYDFFPRFGGGIGMNRLCSAMFKMGMF